MNARKILNAFLKEHNISQNGDEVAHWVWDRYDDNNHLFFGTHLGVLVNDRCVDIPTFVILVEDDGDWVVSENYGLPAKWAIELKNIMDAVIKRWEHVF